MPLEFPSPKLLQYYQPPLLLAYSIFGATKMTIKASHFER
jgi:hypothetical protein